MSNATTTTITTIVDLITKVWQGDVTLPKDVANSLIDVEQLDKERIIVKDNFDNTITFTRNNVTNTKQTTGHKYEMPVFADKVRGLLKQALDGKSSSNIMLTGAMGTGKTEFVYEMAKEMGFKVYQINGSENLTAFDFFGTMAVDVDPITKQNYTRFDKGALYNAFIEGTELDSDGNQILYNEDGTVNTDGTGKPKVVGKPAIFFLDEFAAMLPEVFLGVFNRAMEIPRESGASRTIEISGDNGRVVKSHPSMVMFFSGNTVGTGNNGKYQMSYTAQSNRMDESTLNRITSSYKFGYNRKAEQNIALGLLNDDLEVARLLKLRDNMRNMFKNEQIERVFSTRTLVQICNTAKAYREIGIKNWITESIKTSVYEMLPDNDKHAWNESVRMIWGVDYMQDEIDAKAEYDYL
jgi:MoxR-like ATPase